MVKITIDQIKQLVDSCIETLELGNKNVLVVVDWHGLINVVSATKEVHKALCRRMGSPVRCESLNGIFRFEGGSTLRVLPLDKLKPFTLHGMTFHQVITLRPTESLSDDQRISIITRQRGENNE